MQDTASCWKTEMDCFYCNINCANTSLCHCHIPQNWLVVRQYVVQDTTSCWKTEMARVHCRRSCTNALHCTALSSLTSQLYATDGSEVVLDTISCWKTELACFLLQQKLQKCITPSCKPFWAHRGHRGPDGHCLLGHYHLMYHCPASQDWLVVRH